MSGRRGAGSGGGARSLPFGLGYQDIGPNNIAEFPSLSLPVNGNVSSRDRSIALKYIKFNAALRESPFFTGTLEAAEEGDNKNKKKGKRELVNNEGPSDGIARYSDKYLKKRKLGVSIDEHPFHLELFPKDLYAVMGINKKKLMTLSKFNNEDDIFTGSEQDEALGLSMLEKYKELAEEVDEKDENKKEEDGTEEPVDDEFDDEDDDDDYNAEKYFSGGDDDDIGEDDYGDEPAF